MDKGKKRKRDADWPRIAYHTSTRTFDRLFKEESLAEMKAVARRKLGVDVDTPVSFAQLREGKTVDLEDDDDFDAFYSLAHATNFVNVKVSIGSVDNQPAHSQPTTHTKRKRKNKQRLLSANPPEVDEELVLDEDRTRNVGGNKNASGPSKVSSGANDAVEPRKKKKKTTAHDASVDDVHAEPDTSTPGAVLSTTSAAHAIVENIASTAAQIPPTSHTIPTNARKKQKHKQLVVTSVEEPSTTEPVQKKSKKQTPETVLLGDDLLATDSLPAVEKKSKKRKVLTETEPFFEGLSASESAPVVEKESKKISKAKESRDVLGRRPSKQFQKSQASATRYIVMNELTPSPGKRRRKEKEGEPAKLLEQEQTEGKKGKNKKRKSATDQAPGEESNPVIGASVEEEGTHSLSCLQLVIHQMMESIVVEKVPETGAHKNDQSPSINTKSKPKSRRSTAEDRKAAEADVDAALTRILAAKRASMAASVSAMPAEQIIAEPTLKVKKTKKRKSAVTLDPEAALTENAADSPAPQSGPTESSEPTVSRSASTPRPSGESTCPLCLLSPLHKRETCPLVLGGRKSLENRLSEIQKASVGDVDKRGELIAELQQLLALCNKYDEKKTLSQAIEHPLNGSQQVQSLASAKVSSRSSILGSKSVTSTFARTTTAPDSVTSSDDESDDDGTPAETSILPFVPNASTSLANIDLDDLIRGPSISVLRAADISSPDSSEEEDEEEQILEEDEEKVPRPSRKIDAGDSSDEADSSVEDENPLTTLVNDTVSEVVPGSGMEHISFQAVDQLGESQEIDRSADVAFGTALAADTAVFKLMNGSQSTVSSSQPPGISSALLPSSTQTTSTPLDPAEELLPSQTIVPPPSTHPVKASSGNEDREEPKPNGIAQRMRTRGRKLTNSDKPSSSPKAPSTPRTRLAQASQDIPDSAARRTRAATRRQTLGVMTPPVLPTRPAKRSRLMKEADSRQAIEAPNGVATSSSNSQDNTSLATWATLKPSSPIPDTDADATAMADELQSSSPVLHSTGMKVDNPVAEDASQNGPLEDPLFIQSETQPSFPYSQWQDETQRQEADDPISNDSDDENEVAASVERAPPKPSQTARFRRLTDITSDHGLFSTPTSLRPARFSPAGSQQVTDMYGRSGQDEMESESDSGSDDSDAQEKSHIPASRRAGVRRSKRK
ncbi:hypothetical protein DXG03_003166 [Asterophora parasitica]|uniref:Uncharacterized protein n=1 Tax=Asterophora parasitica TaxID=117018 RepID=A0A9P7KH82_9AGAR|nr:hypothetical protein DXG03_003166 [Asterophora parasitica]